MQDLKKQNLKHMVILFWLYTFIFVCFKFIQKSSLIFVLFTIIFLPLKYETICLTEQN